MIIAAALMLALWMQDTTPIHIRPTDMDQKGHVNNARYIEYLQEGRWAWLDRNRVSNEFLEKETCTQLVVVNINLDYKRPLKYGDKPMVRVKVTQKSEKVVQFHQEITLANDVVASGIITMVTIDSTTHKSKPIPEALKRAISEPR